MFQFSRIGDDVGAKKLLEDLDNLTELTQYIDCQPGNLTEPRDLLSPRPQILIFEIADIGFKLVNDAIHSDQFDLVGDLSLSLV